MMILLFLVKKKKSHGNFVFNHSHEVCILQGTQLQLLTNNLQLLLLITDNER